MKRKGAVCLRGAARRRGERRIEAAPVPHHAQKRCISTVNPIYPPNQHKISTKSRQISTKSPQINPKTRRFGHKTRRRGGTGNGVPGQRRVCWAFGPGARKGFWGLRRPGTRARPERTRRSGWKVRKVANIEIMRNLRGKEPYKKTPVRSERAFFPTKAERKRCQNHARTNCKA